MITTLLDANTDLNRFVSAYGPRWRAGILVDHLDLFTRAGGEHRPGRATLGWGVVDGRAYPVVCGHIIALWTEDGPMDGRCGEIANPNGVCDKHDWER